MESGWRGHSSLVKLQCVGGVVRRVSGRWYLQCLPHKDIHHWESGFCRNVIRMWRDCGKIPILISVYLTGIQLQCPTALALFKKCSGNETVHCSGPPPRPRNYLEETLVHEYFSKTCTRCLLRKFRVLGGRLDLWAISFALHFPNLKRDNAMWWDSFKVNIVWIWGLPIVPLHSTYLPMKPSLRYTIQTWK